MITLQQARTLVIENLRQRNAQTDPKLHIDLVLVDTATEEHDFGWLFYYTNRYHLETGDIQHALAGNAPYLVDRHTGQLHTTGTSSPIQHYIDNYRITRDPHRQPTWHITFTLTTSDTPPSLIEAVRRLRYHFGLSLHDAKHTADQILAGHPITYPTTSHQHAMDLSHTFTTSGFPNTLHAS